jgi:hypothetical protein
MEAWLFLVAGALIGVFGYLVNRAALQHREERRRRP